MLNFKRDIELEVSMLGILLNLAKEIEEYYLDITFEGRRTLRFTPYSNPYFTLQMDENFFFIYNDGKVIKKLTYMDVIKLTPQR